MCYIPPLRSLLSFVRFSIQSKEGFPLTQHISKIIFLVFTNGSGTFFAISHSDNFFETCHFQVAWTPAILFSAILGFPLTSTNRGHCSTHDTQSRKPGGRGVRFNPYMGYIGMCRRIGYCFSGSRSLNRVLFLLLLAFCVPGVILR